MRSLRGQPITETNFTESSLELEIDYISWEKLDEVLDQHREKPDYEEAIEKLSKFADYFPEYFNLADYAAFPLAVTPHLLYFLSENFISNLPWIAVPRLLLSPLCESIGGVGWVDHKIWREWRSVKVACD